MPLALFDLDGTLVDQAAAARLWAGELAADHAQLAGHADAIGRALTARASKADVFAGIVATFALDLEPDELWRQYRRRMPALVRCTDADSDALRRLRDAGWTIGIVTNGEVGNQEGKIRATGLADLVDGWVVSSAIGVRKPDPEIFRAAAAKLDSPLDGWMVGDGLVADIAGGNAVGLRTIWIASDDALDSDTVPTATVSDAAAAADVILSAARRGERR